MILAESWAAAVIPITLASGLLASAGWGLLRLDLFLLQRHLARERAKFPSLARSSRSPRRSDVGTTSMRQRVYVPSRWQGSGTLAWRQCLGVVHYPGAVLISMVLPGVLSLLPLFTDATGGSMVIQIVGSLIFYSFLLMPAALRFDFRRDVDRMAVLKSLPFSPLAITVGQLAAPIVACTLFQLAAMFVALVVRPFPISWLLLTFLVLLPANALIFALENLIFLLYPYRPNQEGVGVFLRSILTFTAKGVLFFIAVLVTWACVSGARFAGNHTTWGTGPVRVSVYFTVALWTVVGLTTAGLTGLITRVFRRFDPSQDTPS